MSADAARRQLRTSNSIESTFATVRHRTKVTKGPAGRHPIWEGRHRCGHGAEWGCLPARPRATLHVCPGQGGAAANRSDQNLRPLPLDASTALVLVPRTPVEVIAREQADKNRHWAAGAGLPWRLRDVKKAYPVAKDLNASLEVGT
jgi:hypothetical protein